MQNRSRLTLLPRPCRRHHQSHVQPAQVKPNVPSSIENPTDAPYRLKNFIIVGKLEAAAPQECEERADLNTRELDEGDLFGIRAIQSGYFGGVVQSRPTSAAGSPSHSPTGSTFPPSSPSLIGVLPISGHGHPPLDIQQPSPTRPPGALLKAFYLPTEPSRSSTTNPRSRVHSALTKSGLRPSEAELNGRINHDPSVNMSLEIPPSPLTPSRPHHFSPHIASDSTSSSGSSGTPASDLSGTGTRTTAGSPSISGGNRSPPPSPTSVVPFPKGLQHTTRMGSDHQSKKNNAKPTSPRLLLSRDGRKDLEYQNV